METTILKYNDTEYYFRWMYYDYEKKVYPKTDLPPNQIGVYKDGELVVGLYRHNIINPTIIPLEECVEIIKKHKV